MGASTVKLYMDTMIASVKHVGFCRADDGRSLGFPPTAPFLTPEAVLTAAAGFASVRRNAGLSLKHRFRIERAAMSINWVVLVRWTEMRAFANRTGMAWPFEDKDQFYEDFERIGNRTEQVLGRGRDSLGAKPLSWYRQQVFNASARAWCRPFTGPHACDPSWVNKQPCCPGCGSDQPPRPGSNLCLNDTRVPPSFELPQWELPQLADITSGL
eukprot:COSAG01_NODE_2222_length_8137_cov_49.268972_3_plen_213_part_00